jgi:hypothetical protein
MYALQGESEVEIDALKGRGRAPAPRGGPEALESEITSASMTEFIELFAAYYFRANLKEPVKCDRIDLTS